MARLLTRMARMTRMTRWLAYYTHSVLWSARREANRASFAPRVHSLKEKVPRGILWSAMGEQRKNSHTSHTHETKSKLKWYYLLVIMPDS